MNRKLLSLLLLAALSCSLLTGCGASSEAEAASVMEANSTAAPSAAPVQEIPAAAATADPEANEKSIIYVDSMSTFMTLTAYGSNRDKALAAAQEEIYRLNDLFSVGVDSSDIATLNREGSAKVSPETLEVVQRALEINDMTGGKFEITVAPLMELWGFTTKNYKVPTQEEIDEILPHVGPDKVTVDAASSTISLEEGTSIDLGGIAKGYTSQRIMEIFEENGVTSGIVSLGGNVQCLSLKPDGSKWKVGIRQPWGSEASLAIVLELENSAVITSGGYERYFTDEETGVTYCHILDPKTGYPVESDLASASIITPDGMLADGLSTALYLMGLEDASQFWREHSDEFNIVLITNDNEIYVSEPLQEAVVSDLPDLHIIEK